MTCSDMPESHPSEPSRLATADPLLNPSKPAAHILLLPRGEGRDEGRSLRASRHGSWSQYVSNIWKTLLSMSREWGMVTSESGSGGGSVAAGVPPAVEGGVPPPGFPFQTTRGRPLFPPGKMPGSTAGETPAATNSGVSPPRNPRLKVRTKTSNRRSDIPFHP
jgi:hypothetical protein